MSQSSDATPAYRGYRLQALYALFRILDQDGNEDLVFQPEKLEDLSIEDENGNLLEVIQVKSGDLTLSSFKESFFLRIYPLVKKQKTPRIIIASFGKVGTELQQAIKGDGRERERVSKKIMEKCESFILSDGEARTILDKLELVYIKESELTEKVYSLLRDTFTGIDLYNAFDNLNYWLYRCSEKKSSITKNDVINKLQNIGKFVAERAAYHEEWFNSIIPIDDQQVNLNKSKLREEFYQGVSAKYDHILANTDVLRPNKIREIETKFNESSVVIIHGASGQGKSTLAYRYLHEHFPNMWRFKIEIVQDRKHALSISRAITGHADVIKFPVAVYLDVSAKDSDWPDLVKQLSTHQNIKILVTIREEDYKRASIQYSEIQFKDIDLAFDKSEAQEIYESLKKAKAPHKFLNFEDAWDRFGGKGPLMEFIYLVTQGESLRNILNGQVIRLNDKARRGEIEPGEIELLRLVSVASAYDARLKVKPLIDSLKDSLKLAAPQRTFELFEKEYLLRLSNNGSLVSGLHPIRSEILASLLTDPIISPRSECASNCLPLIHEQDIETFLLYAFLRHSRDTKQLLAALESWQPDRWIAICGITRALIWLGIWEYVETNRELIQDIFKQVEMGFIFLLDSDISDAIPSTANSTFNLLCSLNSTDENRQRIISYRKRQTDKSQVFTRAKTWLLNREKNPVTPLCNEDWSGMAEVSFWLGRFGISWPFFERISRLELDNAIENLPLEILADLVFGLSCTYEKSFATWRTANASRILNRFREETSTVILKDDGNKVTAHFLIELKKTNDFNLDVSSAGKTNSYLHNETMRIINLLRRILPDRNEYACQGYGHRVWGNEIPFDVTQKTGIPRSMLPPRWLTSVNSTFRGLAVLHYRPQTWEEYSKKIFELRKQTLDAMKLLEKGLNVYFQKQKHDQLFGKLIDLRQWNHYQQTLSKSPLIPLCAVDEWGLVDEFEKLESTKYDEYHTDKPKIIRGLALQKHTSFLALFEEYKRHKQHLTNFINQSINSTMLNPISGKYGENTLKKCRHNQKNIENKAKPELARLSEINLTECIKTVPTFQRKFRQTLRQFIEIPDLDDLERHELTCFHSLWCMWYFFNANPNFTSSNPKKECVKKIDGITINMKKTIEKNLSIISSENLSISVASYGLFWEDYPALWISIDGGNALDVYKSIEGTFQEVFRSINDLADKELAKLIFEINWPLIVIAPKIQGKCLTDKVYRVNSSTLLNNIDRNLNWSNIITQYTIPREALIKLNISIWDIPQLEVANKFVQNTFQLSLQLACIKDLERLPKLDKLGISQIKTYAQKLMDDISMTIQAVLNSSANMINIFQELPSSEYHNHPNMIDSIQALIEVGKYLVPASNSQGEIFLEPRTILGWTDKLDEWRNYSLISYLLWASDIISHENGEKQLH